MRSVNVIFLFAIFLSALCFSFSTAQAAEAACTPSIDGIEASPPDIIRVSDRPLEIDRTGFPKGIEYEIEYIGSPGNRDAPFLILTDTTREQGNLARGFLQKDSTFRAELEVDGRMVGVKCTLAASSWRTLIPVGHVTLTDGFATDLLFDGKPSQTLRAAIRRDYQNCENDRCFQDVVMAKYLHNDLFIVLEDGKIYSPSALIMSKEDWDYFASLNRKIGNANNLRD